MNRLQRFFFRLAGGRVQQLTREHRRMERALAQYMNSAVQAAAKGKAGNWNGIASNRDEDAANKEYLQALADVLQRSQDLDVNNPDLRGFHRARTAQIVGAHVRFKSAPVDTEVNVPAADLQKIAAQIDRVRQLHSKDGGFDSTGHNFSEGLQQVRAVLTAMIHGCCLIHRVWRPQNRMAPLSLELIPGVRISTPIDRQADPKISYGIEYSDEHRTRVVAFHVRRVSQTRGDAFVPDFKWDRLPIDDCSLLSLVEPAGMDRAMPLSVACVRMLRNRGEFMESTVSSARAQAKYYAVQESAPGSNPYNDAEDDADGQSYDANGMPIFSTTLGDVCMLYTKPGAKVNWNSARLPEPNFKDFMEVTDNRMSRGLVSSKSRFTREVNSSWAGGRLEDQQDDPIIDQYRAAMVSAWHRVNVWFLDALWLTGTVKMPGYSSASQIFWSEFRAEFPAKLDVNPQDTMGSIEKGYMLRIKNPIKECERAGTDLETSAEEWAKSYKILEDAEKKYGLKPGTLTPLLSGKALSTAAGADVVPPEPSTEPDPGGDPPETPPRKKVPVNRLRFGVNHA